MQISQITPWRSPTTHSLQLWVNSQNSKATQDSYARHAARLMVITGKKVEDCTLEDLQGYVSVLRNVPAELIGTGKPFRCQPSSTSMTASIQAIQSLFAFLHRAGVIQHNPALLIKTKLQRRVKRIDLHLVSEFVQQCVGFVENQSLSVKDRTAAFTVVVLSNTGMRATEAGNAQMSHVTNFSGRTWLSVVGKGGTLRDVVVPSTLIKLREGLPVKSDWLIPEEMRKSGARLIVWRLVKRAAKLAGVDHAVIHPHLLRHYHASLLLDRGVTLAEARDQLGHGNIAVTSQYLHTEDDKRHDSIDAALNAK